MSKIKSLSDYGELAEKKSYDTFKIIVTRLVQGLFLFKKRKGEVIAGASTFFTLLSFAPVLLIFISLLGVVLSDNATARDYVMGLISESFPRVDKWLYSSLENVINNQLHDHSFGFIELLFLAFTSMGISTSIVFGINIISKVDPDGGLLGDDIRSFITGLGITFYIVLLVCLGQHGPLQEIIKSLPYGKGFVFLFQNSIASSIFSFIFFSLFYKWCPSIKIKYRDAFLGGATFVMSFLVGRSFYWLYLKFFKEDLIKDYGEFTNFMIALIWVYFLLCCFYYGASVAYSANVKLFEKPKKKRKS
ncbi:YihY/virulence factor BrkB family protein [Halobacteriovorax sp. HLS]|uniref:YihY/virulence factor BrkB family protein n=1 Tax=Halobacteriovorax sp. HLS TaxID=2234000 RepID=UPI000FDB8D73|nr:YihY/virulence factor BrkB family protein [Halobacteriovorax sp. HLS]